MVAQDLLRLLGSRVCGLVSGCASRIVGNGPARWAARISGVKGRSQGAGRYPISLPFALSLSWLVEALPVFSSGESGSGVREIGAERSLTCSLSAAAKPRTTARCRFAVGLHVQFDLCSLHLVPAVSGLFGGGVDFGRPARAGGEEDRQPADDVVAAGVVVGGVGCRRGVRALSGSIRRCTAAAARCRRRPRWARSTATLPMVNRVALVAAALLAFSGPTTRLPSSSVWANRVIRAFCRSAMVAP